MVCGKDPLLLLAVLVSVPITNLFLSAIISDMRYPYNIPWLILTALIITALGLYTYNEIRGTDKQIKEITDRLDKLEISPKEGVNKSINNSTIYYKQCVFWVTPD